MKDGNPNHSIGTLKCVIVEISMRKDPIQLFIKESRRVSPVRWVRPNSVSVYYYFSSFFFPSTVSFSYICSPFLSYSLSFVIFPFSRTLFFVLFFLRFLFILYPPYLPYYWVNEASTLTIKLELYLSPLIHTMCVSIFLLH